MPQFDFSTFSSQIFWLLICFGIFYFCVSKIIIPRIASILDIRDNEINKDKISVQDLQLKIDEIQIKSKKLRKRSTLSYNKTIEATLKECALNRENSLNKIKTDIENLTNDSTNKIQNFIAESKSDCHLAAKNIANILVKKIFGQNLKFDKEIDVSINKFKS